MKIAIEGCAHGELETIYDTIQLLEKRENVKVDLLICCGDFQATRTEADLDYMAIPKKYQSMCSFYKYYNGEKLAPILTLFIGGNHEASNYMQELPFGGWAAPNIYYMGYAGVVQVGGVRIGGISGIYKAQDYHKGRFEQVPYDESTKRSVYHIRNIDVFRLKQLKKSEDFDIFLSHDWPEGIVQYGDAKNLFKRKPFLREDAEKGVLGSTPCKELLQHLQPSYWFSAHLHCIFPALVPHENKKTKFLALDKCLPKRRFLQIVDVKNKQSVKLEYDLEWLTILFLTNHLTSARKCTNYMPGPHGNERFSFTPTQEEMDFVLTKFDDLQIPENFEKTISGYNPSCSMENSTLQAFLNPQTQTFCDALGVDDPLQVLCAINGSSLSLSDSLDVSQSSQKARLSLSLPEPKINIESQEEPPDKIQETTNQTEETPIEETNSEELPVKKFRRRNAELYKSIE